MNSIRRIACSAILLRAASVSFALAQSTLAPGVTGTQPQTAARAEATVPFTGTLFFSQEQRERMDRARKSGRVSLDEDIVIDTPRSVINGFVKRSDGATSVWVDGRVLVLAKGSLTDQIQPLSVGTTLTDVRLLVANRVSPDSHGANLPRRPQQKKAAAKKKAE